MPEPMTAEAWLKLGTATISDALDRVGIAGQCAGIHPLAPTMVCAGPAFTVRYGPCGVDRGSVGDYIDDVPPGGVVTLDNTGRLDATVWGDILTEVGHIRRIAGTVIDGICRDSAVARSLNYPVFSLSRWMRTGKDRVQVESIAQPVAIGSIRVSAGDWLVGDGDGVVALPFSRLNEVYDIAVEIYEAEEEIREMVRAGVSLRDARSKVGYHSLQRREQSSKP